MQYQQSAFPYLFLLVVLLIGIPLVDWQLQQQLAEETITIQVPIQSIAEDNPTEKVVATYVEKLALLNVDE